MNASSPPFAGGRHFGARLAGVAPQLVRAPAALVLPPAAPEVDFRRYVAAIDLQDGSQCVEDSFEMATSIATGGKGKRRSPLGWYLGARSRESTRLGQALLDHGSTPQDAIDEAIDRGVYPRDARDDDAPEINLADTWDEEAQLARFQPDDFVPLGTDLATAKQWLTLGLSFPDHGIAAQLVISVTAQFMGLKGPGVCMVDPADEPELGLHGVCLVGYTWDGMLLIGNSYGASWGESGYARIPADVATRIVKSIIIVKGGPVL